MGLLKATATQHDLIVKTVDFNLELWKLLDKNRYGKWWSENNTSFLNESYENEKTWNDVVKEPFLDRVESIIKGHQPKFFGISMLAGSCVFFTNKIVKFVRQTFPHIKIVVGGSEVTYYRVGEKLLEEKLIDFYISGSGEENFVNVLKGNTNKKGINSNDNIVCRDIDSLPHYDFSDFSLKDYPSNWKNPIGVSKKTSYDLYVSFNRGCPFRCTFCSVYLNQPRFVPMSGARIVKEIEHQCSTIPQLTKIVFSDSIINGKLKHFSEFCDELVKRKRVTTDNTLKNIKWQGNFKCLHKNRYPDSLFKKMKEADCDNLFLGIESGSESVRHDMGKNFTNEDIHYLVEKCAKYNINILFSMIVGYITETKKEFRETKQLFYDLREYSKRISVGIAPLFIRKDTLVYNQFKNEPGFKLSGEGWEYFDNDIYERLRRFNELLQWIYNLGYNCNNEPSDAHIYDDLYKIVSSNSIERKI